MENTTCHNKLTNLLFNTCSKVLRALLPVLIRKHKDYLGLSVNDFVKEKKSYMKKHIICERNYYTLFPRRNRATDIRNWDISLLCFITQDILKPDFRVTADIDTLRTIRNELFHSTNTEITQEEYQKKMQLIQLINDSLLTRINDDELTRQIKSETDEIVSGRQQIDNAFELIQEWLETEKELLEEKATFTEDKRRILEYLRSLVISGKVQHIEIPDTRLVLSVKNCRKEDEISITKKFVDAVNRKREQNQSLESLTDVQVQQMNQLIEETFQEFLDEGQIITKAELGCVILTVRSKTFESLERLWTKCMNGDLTKAFGRIQSHLREIYKNEAEIEVMLPESEFWKAIDIIVKDLKTKLPKGTTVCQLETEEESEKIFSEAQYVESSMSFRDFPASGDFIISSESQSNFGDIRPKRTSVEPMKLSVDMDVSEEKPTSPKRSCLEGKVIGIKQSTSDNGTDIEMVLRPRSLKQLEHMKEFSSSGKLENIFRKMAEKMEKVLNVKNLMIDAKFSVLETKEKKLSSSYEKISLSSPESVFNSSTDSIYFPKKDILVSDSTDSFYNPRKVLSSSESAESMYKPGQGAGIDREYSTDSSDSWIDIHPDKDAFRAKNGMLISLLKSNISEARGDILVISLSNKLVLRTARLGKAVLKEAGEELQQELKTKYPKGIQYGEIAEGRKTGNLRFKAVYVTALPDWSGNDKDLRSITSMCLEKAASSNMHAVVFSALGCGGSNYPKDEAARALFQAVLDFDQEHAHGPIKEVSFLLYQRDTACIQAFEDELKERQKIQMKQNEGKTAIHQFRMKWQSTSKDGKPVTIREGKKFLRDAFKYILEVDTSTRLAVIIDEGQGTSTKGPDVKKFFKRIFDKSLRHESDMFSGLDRGACCVPTDSFEPVAQKWFYALGKAIVLSQVHGGPKFQHLAEYVIQYACGGNYEKHLNILMVSDMDLVKLIHKINRCSTQEDFKVCFKEVQRDYLHESKWMEDILIGHCEEITRHLLKWYLVDKRKEALEQLREGLNTLSFLGQMRHTPGALDILRHQGYGKITASSFRESIEKSLKAMKTESDTHEKARLLMFKFMDQMTDEDASMFAHFISGKDRQPVLRSHFDIQFNMADVSQTAPLAEPVKHKLIIPLGNKSKKEFFSSIRKAIQTPPPTPE